MILQKFNYTESSSKKGIFYPAPYKIIKLNNMLQDTSHFALPFEVLSCIHIGILEHFNTFYNLQAKNGYKRE